MTTPQSIHTLAVHVCLTHCPPPAQWCQLPSVAQADHITGTCFQVQLQPTATLIQLKQDISTIGWQLVSLQDNTLHLEQLLLQETPPI
jgi:hypothetical protein